MKNFTKQCFLLLALVLIAQVSFAQITLTLQPNADAGKDVYLDGRLPNQNFGNSIEFDVMAWTYNSTFFVVRSLIDFDLTSIPPNAQIQQATLYLYCNVTSGATQLHSSYPNSPYPNPNTSIMQRITSAWDENTATFNNQPSVTGLNAVLISASTSQTQNFQINMTPLVQDYVNNPSTSFGFMFGLQTEQTYRSLIFGSSDNADPLLHPKLVISYTFPTSTNNYPTNKALIVYPNPANNTVNIQGAEGASINIYNMNGIKMASLNAIDYNTSMDVQNWATGIYYIKVIDKDNSNIVYPFVKE